MKAAEVLRLYEAGQRDFKGVSLRGQSFKGKDLSGADFTGADIRSTNFTNTNLTGVKFVKAKAGLQRRWAARLIVVSLLISVLSGLLLGLPGYYVSRIFDSSSLDKQGSGWSALAVIVVFLFLLLRKGIGVFPKLLVSRSPVSVVEAEIITRIVSMICIGMFAGCIVGGITGAIAGYILGGIAGGIAGVGGGAAVGVIAGIGVGVGSIVIAIAGAVAGAIAGVRVVILVGVVAIAGACSVTLFGAVTWAVIAVSAYVGWRALKVDGPDVWIRSVAAEVATTGGTNFCEATLTDADFSQTLLKSCDFSRSVLLRTHWRDAEKLDYIRSGETYLKSYEIRRLLRTGNGKDQSFAHLTNFQGLNLQYSNLMRSDFTGTALVKGTFQGANLADAVLIKADLSYVNLQGADLSGSNLYQARLEHINLQGANLRGANLQGANLRGLDLANVDLSEADLEADLTKTNLSGGNLSGANLRAVQALETNFEKATFTGACLKDLNINSSTNLKDIVCDYVFLEDDYRERRPHGGSFGAGEFTQRFQQVLETVDLFFDDGVDWKAFLGSFQDLQAQYGDENLAVQGIERKGQSSFEIRLAVPPEADKAEIEKVAYERYEINLRQIETQYREQLSAKEGEIIRYRQQTESLKDELLDTYRQRSRQSAPDLMEVVKILAARDSIVNVEANAVAENKASKYDMRNARFAGGFAETVQGDQGGGTINNQASETPSLTEATAEIQNLLKQLETSNPAATKAEQIAYLSAMIPPTRRERLIGALRAAGSAAIEEVLYGAILKSLVEGWQRPKGDV